MSLRDTIARHARTTLVRADHHGETVRYVFKNPDGEDDRTFLAVVNRLDNVAAAPGVPQVAHLRATIFLPRHGTDGVLAVAPGDRIEVAMRLGSAAVLTRIQSILEQDEGGFLVEVHA